MNLPRPLKLALGWGLALGIILAALAISPHLQTRCVNAYLGGRSDVRGSLDSFSARFGRLSVSDLRLEYKGARLTVPVLQARLPITRTLFTRRLMLERLAGKGWVLDLSQYRVGTRRETATTATEALFVLSKLVGGGELPFDLALEEVMLEGEVLLPGKDGSAPLRWPWAMEGRGFKQGGEGTLNFRLSSGPAGGDEKWTLSTSGQLKARMDTSRTLHSLSVDGACIVGSDTLASNLRMDLKAELGRIREGLRCDLDFRRNGKPSLEFHLVSPTGMGGLSGSWKASFDRGDLSFLSADLTSLSFHGTGHLELPPTLSSAHCSGQAALAIGDPGRLHSALRSFSSLELDTAFDGICDGKELRLASLELTLANPAPVLKLRTVKPITLMAAGKLLSPTQLEGDWFEAELVGFPVSWLSGLMDGLSFEGGALEGRLGGGVEKGAVRLQSREPLQARGVALSLRGKTLASGLDLSVALGAKETDQGWLLEFAPLHAAASGRKVGEATGSFFLPFGKGQSTTAKLSWGLDLAALTDGNVVPGVAGTSATSISGDNSLRFGRLTEVEGSLILLGPADRQLSTKALQLKVSGAGAVTLDVPVQVRAGGKNSEFELQATIRPGVDGLRVDGKISSPEATEEQLSILLRLLGGAGGATGDDLPLWGRWTGLVNLSLGRFHNQGDELKELRGLFELSKDAIRVEHGSCLRQDASHRPWRGALEFQAKPQIGYRLSVSGELGETDATDLFGKLPPDKDPPLHGRFTTLFSQQAQGPTWEALLSSLQTQYTIKSSKGGILRMLNPGVVDDFVDTSSRAANMVGSVGDAMGMFFGVNDRRASKPLKAQTQRSLDLYDLKRNLDEFRFDTATLQAVSGPDGIIRVTSLDIEASELRLVGDAELAPGASSELTMRPLKSRLRLGFRGALVDKLTSLNLLSGETDDRGYALFKESVELGGTLLSPDNSQLQAILRRASRAPVDSPSK